MVTFDGSTYREEALVIILRYIAGDFNTCQRLVRLHVLARRLNGQKLFREIVTLLASQLQYRSERIVAVTHDGASVNGATVVPRSG